METTSHHENNPVALAECGDQPANPTKTGRSANLIADTGLLILGTIGTCITYCITRALIRFAPERTYREKRDPALSEDDVLPPSPQCHDDRIVRFAVFLYKKSWIRKRLYRYRKTRCFFVPSCSEYAVLATRKYGLIRGLILIGGRFRRCNPRYRGDYVDFP
jgi:putative component of membrane protein insertase Oxa1/YidC/SpoIIIJ protein YidD